MRTRANNIVKNGLRLALMASLILAVIIGVAPRPSVAAPTANIIHVNSNAGTGGDGATWGTAYKYLQDALAAATSGDEIWVAAGIYYPDEGGNVTDGDRDAVFNLKEGVAIYGGFAGGETSRDQRDWDANVTVLSGDIDKNDVKTNGVVNDAKDINGANSFRVVYGSGITKTAVLDGFSITAGLAEKCPAGYPAPANPFVTDGAGVRMTDASPILANLVIVGNRADSTACAINGAGVSNAGNGKPQLLNVTIRNNFSNGNGGGMSSQGSPLLNNVRVTNNRVKSRFGPVNFTGIGGGGIFATGSPILFNVQITGNETDTSGGGILFLGAKPVLSGVEIRGNTATNTGGLKSEFSDVPMNNVLIAGNRAEGIGGAALISGEAILENVTIAGNLGGGLYFWGENSSQYVIRNSIIWGNQSVGVGGIGDIYIVNDDVTASYSLLPTPTVGEPWTDGGNNPAYQDPRFLAPEDASRAPTSEGDYRLHVNSAAIDTGDNGAIPTNTTDLAGYPRIVNGTVDMGAYESQVVCPAAGTTRLYVDAHTGVAGLGTSWTDALPSLQSALTVADDCLNNSVSEVWVAQGTYYPDDGGIQIDGDRAAAFQLQNDLAIYGGFLGNENDLGKRNPWSHITVLSGDIDQDDNTDAHDLVETPADIVGDNSYHVVMASNTNGTAMLDGFAITGGQANGSLAAKQHEGGGFFAESGSPTLNNLTFAGNVAEEGGAMTLVGGSNPSITNASFRGNAASDYGGALHNESSNPTLTNVQMTGNRAAVGGGAIYNLASGPELTNVTIAGNAAGGTVSLATVAPAAVDIAPAGGGIFNLTGSKPEIRNSVIWNNEDSTGTGTTSASIRNLDTSSTPSADYSDIQGLTSIGGLIYDGTSIDADPQFVAPVGPASAPSFGGDYRLKGDSPAIDVGNNAFNSLPKDLAQRPRIQGTTIDMGAYEATSAPHVALHKSVNTPTAKVSATVSYTYEVVNTGAVTLTAISATDDRLGTVDFGVSELAPSASATTALSYTVSEGDLPGPLTNTATVTATSSVSGTVVATDTASVSLSYRPQIMVLKTASPPSALPGDVVTYSYVIENTGDVSLSSVSATDSALGAVKPSADTLAPGATATGTLSYTVQSSDLPGPLVNTVDAQGTSPVGTVVKDQDSATVGVVDPNPPSATGQVIIQKKTAPGGGTGFAFSGDLGTFNLDDAGIQTINNVAPGRYSVTEADPSGSGYELSGLTCVDSVQGGTASSGDVASRTATINVDPGETVTCTFTNTEDDTVTVEKVTIPASTVSFGFGSDLGDFDLAGGSVKDFTNVTPGSYTLSEDDPTPTGYELTGIECVDSATGQIVQGDVDKRSVELNLVEGERVHCTFTNTKPPGTVIIRKATAPGGGTGFAFIGDLGTFFLDDGGIQTSNVAPGSYSVTEADPSSSGYELSGLTCVDSDATGQPSAGDVASRTATINVDPGETVTCTFTNSEDDTITVEKVTIPASTDSFGFGGDLGDFDLAGGSVKDFTNVTPGAYTISEDDPSASGYELTGIECVDSATGQIVQGDVDKRSVELNLVEGERVHCTFTNERKQIEPTSKNLYLPLIGK